MSTENNWLSSNLSDRFKDFNSDFEVKLTPQKFKYLSFEDASKEAALKIANKNENIFISLSGGLDSEYILVLYHHLKIPVKPIIITFKANELESSYAFHICKKLSITPIVIKITNEDFLYIFKNEIVKKINGNGLNMVPVILSSKYAHSNKGSLITGEHVIYDDHSLPEASVCEWDLYPETLYPERETYTLLNYTPEIVYSIVNQFDESEVQEFKSKLYNLNYRPKIKNIFTDKEIKLYRESRNILSCPKTTHSFGKKDVFLNKLKEWNNV